MHKICIWVIITLRYYCWAFVAPTLPFRPVTFCGQDAKPFLGSPSLNDFRTFFALSLKYLSRKIVKKSCFKIYSNFLFFFFWVLGTLMVSRIHLFRRFSCAGFIFSRAFVFRSFVNEQQAPKWNNSFAWRMRGDRWMGVWSHKWHSLDWLMSKMGHRNERVAFGFNRNAVIVECPRPCIGAVFLGH